MTMCKDIFFLRLVCPVLTPISPMDTPCRDTLICQKSSLRHCVYCPALRGRRGGQTCPQLPGGWLAALARALSAYYRLTFPADWP